MSCARCGTELLPGKKFCHACGAPARVPCPRCGAELDPAWGFCPDCGLALGGAQAPAPAPSLEPAPLAPSDADERLARLAQHIPESLAKRIRAAGAAAGERKRTTVFFCDLVGSTEIAERLDPEEYRELLDEYLARVFAEIYRYEGIVNQLAGDGLMALFGAPIAHEDAPERAVRAALAIQSSLTALSAQLDRDHGLTLRARIGIHTGIVVAGAIGNDLKMDYTAIGDTTNLAARLQGLAEPGSILISEATHALLRGGFEAQPVGPIDVRGKSEPVSAWRVVGLATRGPAFADDTLTPFVGRDAELGQLESCFDAVDSHLAQIVSIVGDAGIGKSRLVHEFKRRLAKREFEILEARCSSLTRAVPYAPWRAMLRAWFGIAGTDDDACSCAKIEARLEAVGGKDSPGYPELCWMLSVDSADGSRPPSDDHSRGFEAVARAIEETSRRVPVVMIIEDLHWIDRASREILEAAVARTDDARVMLVTTHRPDYRPTWQSNAAFTQMRLRPLRELDAAQIVAARAGGVLPAELESRILRRADGNPFYLEELTRTLVEDGTLVARGGRVEVTREPDEIRIPDTIGEVVGARIDRLPPAAKRVAQIAAVLGRQFPSRHVAALLAGSGIDAAEQLGELERRGVVHRNGAATDEYRFGESLTQEIAYEGLLLRERRQLHDRVAELLENEGRDLARFPDGRARIALAAHHMARGEDRERGIGALLDAAAEAEALPSYGDAMRLFREAWQLADTALGDRRESAPRLKRLALRAAVGICNAAVVYGDSDSEKDELAARRGIALAEELGDQSSRALLQLNYGMVVMNSGRERFGEGVALIEHAGETAAELPNGLTTMKVRRGVVWAYLLDGRLAEARRVVEEVLAELVRVGEEERSTDVYMGTRFFRNRVLIESDELEEAERDAAELHERCERVGNRTLFCGTASTLSAVAAHRGDFAAAERWARLAIPVAQEIGNLTSVRSATATLILSRAERGEPDASPAELDSLERGLFSSGDLGINTESVVEAMLAVGERERARRIAEARVALSGGRLRATRAALVLGLVALDAGGEELSEAERLFGEALLRAREIGVRSLEGRALLGLAEVAHQRGESDAMDRHARQALAVLRPLGFLRHAMRAARLLLERVGDSAPNA